MKPSSDLPWEDAEAFVLRRLSLRNLRVLSALSEGGGLTAAAERLRRKQKLAGALRIFGRFGFGEGVVEQHQFRDCCLRRRRRGSCAPSPCHRNR